MSQISRRSLFVAAASAAASSAASSVRGAGPPVRAGGPAIRVGLCAYSYRDQLTGKREPRMDLTHFVERAAEIGAEGVELTSYYFPSSPGAEYLSALKRRCFLLGLHISGTSVSNDFTMGPGPERDAQILHVRKWIEHSADLGAPCMRVFAGAARTGQTEREARANCVECLEICCADAARRGVVLAVENHGGVVATPEGILEIVTSVQSDWCGINLDTGNFRTADPYADMAKCAPWAVTTHFKSEIAPGGGPKRAADLNREIAILRSAGYRGYLSLEYEAAEDPAVAVPRIVAAMRRAARAGA